MLYILMIAAAVILIAAFIVLVISRYNLNIYNDYRKYEILRKLSIELFIVSAIMFAVIIGEAVNIG